MGKDIFEGRQPGLISFSITHFSGYLFFLIMPVEIAFVYYLTQYDPINLVIIALVTAMIAQIIDYAIGYLLSETFINKVIGQKKYEKTKKLVRKYGKVTIFVFNLFPLSSPIVALVAGVMRYKLRHVILYSFFGLAIKYIVLSIIFI